jgi:selenide,water dikinase
MVMTIDVITPIVDDPRAFGGIAAANSMSDVWAMGGRPEVALSFVGFPSDKLPLETLTEVLQGVRDACARARCAVVGGHTVSDSEPKCGLAVVGSVDPARVWSHRSARQGDVLVLTKALGTGVIGQAIKAGAAEPASAAAATAQMLALNDVACEVGLAAGASSCTDITGFGLLGHLKHVVEASGLGAVVWSSRVPLLEGARACVERGFVPGGSKRNLAYATPVTSFGDALDPTLRTLLADAQTSGGLLLAVPEAGVEATLARLRDGGCERAAAIGQLEAAAGPQRIRVLA